jgi:hypothetical protein
VKLLDTLLVVGVALALWVVAPLWRRPRFGGTR